MFPKDKEEMKKKSNIIYWYKCGRTECDEEYIGESARTLMRDLKSISRHHYPSMSMTTQLATKQQWINFKIIGREGHGISRTIQEAIYIRVNNPTLNRNVGKYNLPHIWDKVLFTIPELKIN